MSMYTNMIVRTCFLFILGVPLHKASKIEMKQPSSMSKFKHPMAKKKKKKSN